MNKQKLAVVTGAFSYQGKYITRILLEKGYKVRTLTGHPNRPNEFGGRVEAVQFHFDEPAELVDDLKGADVLFNTYWVRFNYSQTTYGQAVANTQNLIRAAKEAEVGRFVHISITKPSLDSLFPYFRGKAVLEKTLCDSGLSYAIVRPTAMFGKEDILINNITWLLRRSPVFGIFGKGDYRIQPVFVGDVAALAVALSESEENVTVDAVGPETYAFADLVRLLKQRIGSKTIIANVPPMFTWMVSLALNPIVGDVVITRDEIGGLMNDLLVSEAPPTCTTRLSEWTREHAAELGTVYSSELARHFR